VDPGLALVEKCQVKHSGEVLPLCATSLLASRRGRCVFGGRGRGARRGGLPTHQHMVPLPQELVTAAELDDVEEALL